MFGSGRVAQTVGSRQSFRVSIRPMEYREPSLRGDYTISPVRSLWHVTVRETFLDELELGGTVGIWVAGTGFAGSTGSKK